MRRVTIVVPAYNEAENLVPFFEETGKVFRELPEYDFEYLFVDDGSTDQTHEILKRKAAEDPSVHYLSFTRNFGKEAAIYAGLQKAEGEFVILMDGDLQHPPALIKEMLQTVEGGAYEAAGAKRKSGASSTLFTKTHNRLSSVKIEKGATDYMCMSRKFLDAVLALSERQRFSKGLFAWVGFEIRWFSYEQNPRLNGKSKWKPFRLYSYAADGITSFSIIPLQIVTVAGAVICLLAFIYIIITLIKTLIFGIDVPGYVTTLCAILALGGVILLSIGILGAYIGRIFLEVKERPMYVLKESDREEGTKGSAALSEEAKNHSEQTAE